MKKLKIKLISLGISAAVAASPTLVSAKTSTSLTAPKTSVANTSILDIKY